MIRSLLIQRETYDSIALIDAQGGVTYRQICQKAAQVQKLLSGADDENIAIFLPNGADYIAAFYGIIMMGCTAFPLSAHLTRHEILPLIKQAAVRYVVTSEQCRHIFGHSPSNLQIICIDAMQMDQGYEMPRQAQTHGDARMVLLSTSGTTGASKLVQLSENNVAAAVNGYLGKMHYEGIPHVRYLLGVPLTSAYGLMILACCLKKSFPLILLGGALTLDAYYEAVQNHRVTHYEGSTSVVLLMEQMAGRPIPYDISSLKYMAFGGSKISGQTIENLRAAYPGVAFYQGYGMTEASPLITKEPIKPCSVGTAIQDVKIAVKTEDGITDAPYVRGEIVVKGPNVMLGYYENEEETLKTLKDGYLHTGDIGYLDEDGDLYLCGRKKNLIIVRGFNVQPEEVEECAMQSKLVKDCRCFGQEDAFGNETLQMDAVPMEKTVTTAQIRAYLSAHLADYKLPQSIQLCERLQKNAAGKTMRHNAGQPG